MGAQEDALAELARREKAGELSQSQVEAIQELRRRGVLPDKTYALSEVPAEALSNIPESAGRMISGMGTAIAHPIDTVTGLAKVAAGGVEKLIPESMLPGGRANEKSFDAVYEFFAKRYGGYENLKKTMAEDPVGFMADVSTVLGAGGSALKLAGKAADVNALTTAGNVAAKAAEFTNPVNLAVKGGKLAIAATGKGLQGIAHVLGNEGIQTQGIAYRAAKAGGSAQQDFLSQLRGTTSETTLAQELRDGTQALKDLRAQEYTAKLNEIVQQSGATQIPDATGKISAAVKDIATRFRIKKISYDPTQAGSNWRFEGLTTLPPADKLELGKMLDIVVDWAQSPDKNTVLGLDSLKQQLDNFYTQNSRIGAISANLKSVVKGVLTENVQGYTDLTSKYAEATDRLAELNSALSIGKKGNTLTVIRKVGTTMRGNPQYARDLVAVMDQMTGKNTLASMAGSASSPLFSTGMLGRGATMGSIGTMAYHGAVSPGLVGLIGLSSPRLHGEISNLLGTGARYAGKAAPYTASMTEYGPAMFQAGRLEDELKRLQQEGQ